MAALTAVQRLLAQGAKAFFEYVPVLMGGQANAYQIPALDANGLLSQTMMPSGVGPDTQVLPASEALSAGALVNIYNNNGTATARNADGSVSGKPAYGFVLASVATGANATVYLSGINNAITGATPGDAYLSDTSPGGISSTGATIAGHSYQSVGVVTAAGALQFNYSPPVTRA